HLHHMAGWIYWGFSACRAQVGIESTAFRLSRGQVEHYRKQRGRSARHQEHPSPVEMHQQPATEDEYENLPDRPAGDVDADGRVALPFWDDIRNEREARRHYRGCGGTDAHQGSNEHDEAR